MSTSTNPGGGFSGPIHFPPPVTGPGPTHQHDEKYFLPIDKPLEIQFHSSGFLEITNRHFFHAAPFPEGTFGKDSILNGYFAREIGEHVDIIFKYSDGDREHEVAVYLVVVEACGE